MQQLNPRKCQYIINRQKIDLNSLSTNPKKWSNTLKQFVRNLPTICLSVFDYFVGLALKGLTTNRYRHNTPRKCSEKVILRVQKVLKKHLWWIPLLRTAQAYSMQLYSQKGTLLKRSHLLKFSNLLLCRAILDIWFFQETK